MTVYLLLFFFFFFNDTATTEIYTLSLHDALPICHLHGAGAARPDGAGHAQSRGARSDRKSTRLNSSHTVISYAVFCLKKKNQTTRYYIRNKTQISLAFVTQELGVCDMSVPYIYVR